MAVTAALGPQASSADEVMLTDSDRAQLVQKVAQIEAMVIKLTVAYDENAKAAETMRAQCSEVVLGFDKQLVAHREKRRALDTRGGELLVTMARSLESNKNSIAAVEKLRKDVEAARDSMAELENNMVLLQRWWWVPGYGQYLAVKTLVNNEEGQLHAIREELQDRRLQLANLEQLINHASTLICEVKEERESVATATTALQCVSEAARKNSEEIRKRTVDLLDREDFYRKLNGLVTITVDGRQRALADALTSQRSPRILAQIATRAAQLDGALEELRQKIQEGRRFLEDIPDNFCGREVTGNDCVTPDFFWSLGSSAWADGRVSFETKCKDVRMEGDGTVLSASCGSAGRSSGVIRDVHNKAGKLVQTTIGTSLMGQNKSSFQDSCRGVFICGRTLTASCKDPTGRFAQTSLVLTGVFALDGKIFTP